MSSSHTGGGFAAHGFGSCRPGAGQHLTDTIDQLRSMFEQRVRPRMGKGDVRAAILALLAENPLHGYQIIAEIGQRSGGAWRPSPSSVYPTLQLLNDEGLISSEAADGRKTYSLTEAGQTEVAASAGHPAPWEAASGPDLLGMGALPKSAVALAHAASQVKRTGTAEQVEQAVTVLDEARRKLYAILAQD
ncbi:MAG: PadR family transcriptional regulator [Microbacteriaceae bacterium]